MASDSSTDLNIPWPLVTSKSLRSACSPMRAWPSDIHRVSGDSPDHRWLLALWLLYNSVLWISSVMFHMIILFFLPKVFFKAGILCSSTQLSLEHIPLTYTSKTIISTLVFLHACQRNEHFILWVRRGLKVCRANMGLFWWSCRKHRWEEKVWDVGSHQGFIYWWEGTWVDGRIWKVFIGFWF